MLSLKFCYPSVDYFCIVTALKMTLLTYKYTTVYRNNVTEVGSSTMIARLQIIAIGNRNYEWCMCDCDSRYMHALVQFNTLCNMCEFHEVVHVLVWSVLLQYYSMLHYAHAYACLLALLWNKVALDLVIISYGHADLQVQLNRLMVQFHGNIIVFKVQI